MQSHEIVIEDGRKIKLIYPHNKERCTLKCEDGNLEMPAFELEFIENKAWNLYIDNIKTNIIKNFK